jgi:hypothetical protein
MHPYDTIEMLTARLRFLETRECRNLLSEEARVEQRRDVTQRFRNLLKREEMYKVDDARRKAAAKMYGVDELYA